MSKRSVASATISFGLVSIPVKFYLTAHAESVNFNMITPKGNRVKQKLVDSVTGEDIEYGACNKGYEFAKDQFVIFTKDELKALGESDGGTMEIKEFVPCDDLQLIAVEKSYYLDAGKGGDKAYRLFVAALKKQGKCAVAQWTSRGRQHLVVIGAKGDALVVYQMFYADEMREFELDCAKFDPRDVEIDLACKLMETLSNDHFDSSKYKDSYRERVDAAVAKKQGGESVNAPSESNAPPVSDLFAALQASLGAQTGKDVKVTSSKVEEPTAPAAEAPAKKSRSKKSAA
jgi:DNA end-binding protein Ku